MGWRWLEKIPYRDSSVERNRCKFDINGSWIFSPRDLAIRHLDNTGFDSYSPRAWCFDNCWISGIQSFGNYWSINFGC